MTYTPPFRFDGSRCISSIITLYTPEYLLIFAIRILTYPIAWWLARRGTPWVVAGARPPIFLRASFLVARRRLVGLIGCCAGAGDAAAGRERSGSQRSTAARLVARADVVLETLHAIEPAAHCFNLLAIAVGPGVFSPVVALAAAATVGCKHALFWTFGRLWPRVQPDDAATPSYETPAMPIACAAMLLFFASVYLIVLLSTAGALWAELVVTAVNWASFGLLLWRIPIATARDTHVELTEMLLVPDDVDA